MVRPAWILMSAARRGSKLEVIPTQRAIPRTNAAGQPMANHIATASAAEAINAAHLGVVFNHAMQAQGFITGEISFQVKPGRTLPVLDPASYPGLKWITKPEVYVVVARNPAEFVTVLKRLQARTDLKWVEPTVQYGPSDAPNPLR